jgi:hypothetical protein
MMNKPTGTSAGMRPEQEHKSPENNTEKKPDLKPQPGTFPKPEPKEGIKMPENKPPRMGDKKPEIPNGEKPEFPNPNGEKKPNPEPRPFKNDIPVNKNPETGRMTIEVNSKPREIKVLPEDAAKKVEGLNNRFKIKEVKLGEQNKNKPDDVEYDVEAVKEEKFFGLFKVEIPTKLKINAESGEVTSNKQDFRQRVLDWFSF